MRRKCGPESHQRDRPSVLLATATHRPTPTPRQLEVAAAVVRCGGYKEAADALGIAYGTLAKTLARLMERQGTRSTTSLAARLMAYPEFDRLVGPKEDWLP